MTPNCLSTTAVIQPAASGAPDYLDTGPYKAAAGSLWEELTVTRLRMLVDDVAARVPLAITATRPELAHIDADLLGWAVRAVGEKHFAVRKYGRVRGRTNPVIPAGTSPTTRAGSTRSCGSP
jgi:hypothetical protein